MSTAFRHRAATADSRDRSKTASRLGRAATRGIRKLASATLAGSMIFGALVLLPGSQEQAAVAAPATGTGRYASDIYWLDWSTAQNTVSQGTNNGRPYSRVQNGTSLVQEPLPGFRITTTFSKVAAAPQSGSGTRELHVTRQDPSWSEVKLNGYDTGNQYSVITPNANASTVSFSLNFVATLNGVTIPLNVIATDGESAGAAELTTFTTDGEVWRNIDNTTRTGARMWKSSKTNGGFGTTVMGPWATELSTGQGMAPIGVSRSASTVDVTITASGMQNVMVGVMLPVDYGDAPASYGSASHLIDWTAAGDPMALPGSVNAPRVAYAWDKSPYLGSVPADADDGSLGNWTGDDQDPTGNPADEGWEQLTGTTTPPRIFAGQTQDYSVEVLTSASAEGKTVAAWIDWNNNGSFDQGERTEAVATGGKALLSWSQVTATDTGSLGARFRVASDAALIAEPTGLAIDGEVEDYLLPVTRAANVEKTSSPVSGTEILPGSTVAYTLSFPNPGNQELVVDYTDHLTGVLDDAELIADTVEASDGLTVTVGEESLRIQGFVPAQSTNRVTYAVKAKQTGFGDAVLRNVVVPGAGEPPAECIPAEMRCTEHPVSAIPNLAKVADPTSGSPVVPGQTITYTVTAANTGGPGHGTVISDDLSDVLDDATFTPGSAQLTVGNADPITLADPSDTTLQTQPFTLPAGGTATLTYSVTVNDDAWNASVGNVVAGVWGADRSIIDCNGCATVHTALGVLVQKVGESAEAEIVPMEGSEWAVYTDVNGSPGESLDETSITSVDPTMIRLQNLPAGSYWLEETQAPDGFSLLAERVPFAVAADGTVTLAADADERTTAVSTDEVTGMSVITVRDVPALELPESGGPGSAGFLLLGGLLTAAAVGLTVTSRRRSEALTPSA